MPGAHKIALILAGGGSIGAFESGVVTELLHLLQQRNAEGPHHFEIDVITGASAGGVVGALAARYLQDGPADDLAQNPLYRAWVTDIDIRSLLAEAPKNAAFSKSAIYQILRDGLIRDPQAGAILRGTGTPFTCAPDVLRLAMTLSNLQGITYQVPFLQIGRGANRNFITTSFKDLATFLVRKDDPEATKWDRVGRAAMACANLPIAFQPEQVERSPEDYPGALEAANLELLEKGLSFIDGGLFDNKPVGEAIRLAREADGGPSDRRLYLLVDPKLDTSRHDPDITPDSSLPDQLGRIATMIREQSVSREWLRICRRNQELDWRDGLAEHLARLIAGSSPELDEELRANLQQFAEEIIERKRQLFGASRYPESYLEASLERLERQPRLMEAEHSSGESDAKRRIFRLITFILNNAGGLQNKDDLRLGLIGADKQQLAGEEFHGLLGFFDQKLRQHDFDLGRFQAKNALPAMLDENFPRAGASAIGDLVAQPPVPPGEFTLANTDELVREQLCEQLVIIADESFQQLGLPVRGLLRVWARRKLRRMLELD